MGYEESPARIADTVACLIDNCMATLTFLMLNSSNMIQCYLKIRGRTLCCSREVERFGGLEDLPGQECSAR